MKKTITLLLMLVLTTQVYAGQSKKESSLWWESKTITKKAWKALREKNYEKAIAEANKCIKKFENIAKKQEKKLKTFPNTEDERNWALNDVATCYFIKGLAYKEQGDVSSALDIFFFIMEKFPHAQCWDPYQSLWWKVALGAKDQIYGMAAGVDFGNSSPDYLVSKAWEELNKKHYNKALIYAKRCLRFNYYPAVEAHKKLTEPAENTIQNTAVNKVGECLLILSHIYKETGKTDLALTTINEIQKNFFYSQIWNKGESTSILNEALKLKKQILKEQKAKKAQNTKTKQPKKEAKPTEKKVQTKEADKKQQSKTQNTKTKQPKKEVKSADKKAQTKEVSKKQQSKTQGTKKEKPKKEAKPTEKKVQTKETDKKQQSKAQNKKQ